MLRKDIYKAAEVQLKGLKCVNSIFFIFFTIIFIVSRICGEEMTTADIFKGSVLCSVITFIIALEAYVLIIHDVIFKNVKTMRGCIYECEQNWKLVELFLKKEDDEKDAKNGFKVWIQGVDGDGRINPIGHKQIQKYEYPAELELKSGNFDLYYEIEKLRNKHIKVRNDGEEAEAFLYGEITYVEKSKLIVGFKYLGTKNYA